MAASVSPSAVDHLRLQPLRLPPVPAFPPDLPCARRESSFTKLYALSTHIVPAAYPRTPPHRAPPTLPRLSLPKDERKAGLKDVEKQIQHAHANGSRQARGNEQEQSPLWLCLNRYACRRPVSVPAPALTLLCTHGNGFPKETWEPTLQALLSNWEGNPHVPLIAEVWSLDAVQHGDSGLLNSNRLSDLSDWADLARDTLHFLLHYLPEHYSEVELPTHLTRLPDAVSQTRRSQGFQSRTVTAFCHSLGGSTIAIAAKELPTLFSSIVLIDSPISPKPPISWYHMALKGALSRRDRWPSRAAALAYFQKWPYFINWSPSALHGFVMYALVEDTDGVRLKTDVVQEAIAYDPHGPPQAWACLAAIERSVALHWIMPNTESPWGTSRMDLIKHRVGNTSSCFMNSGHFIPMEKPSELAMELAKFLEKKYGAYLRVEGARL